MDPGQGVGSWMMMEWKLWQVCHGYENESHCNILCTLAHGFTWSPEWDRTNQRQRYKHIKILISQSVCVAAPRKQFWLRHCLPSFLQRSVEDGAKLLRCEWTAGGGQGGHLALITCRVRGLHGLWALHAASHSITATEWRALSRHHFGLRWWRGAASDHFSFPGLMDLTAMEKRSTLIV